MNLKLLHGVILMILSFIKKNDMAKDKTNPQKVRLVFEAEINPTKCCECVFGGTCPYVCAFANKLDCKTYDLSTLKFIGEEVKEEEV